MVSPSTQKLLVIIGTILILIGFGYYIWTKESADTIAVPPSDEEIAGQDIVLLVEDLKSVSIDKSFFSSDLFVSLRDLSVPIIPESFGRPNPFGIIGIDR